MFRIRTAYHIFIPAALIVFSLLCLGRVIPYTAVNILFLLIAPVGYFYPGAVSLILGGAAWLLYPVFLFIFRADPLNAAFPIIVFNGLQLGFVEARFAVQQNVLKWGERFCEEEYRKNSLTDESEKITAFENDIRLKELEIVNLYEITKKMSEGLKLDEVFAVFNSFLSENFKFRRCELLVLKQEGAGPVLEGRYEAWGQGEAEGPKNDINHEKLIRLFVENPRERHFSKDADGPLFIDLGIDGASVDTFIGVPLLSEKIMVGIFIIENPPKRELEKFAILSMQLALEIKKVLLYEMVERLAITDSLTGLYLRRYFLERLDEEIKRAERHKLKFAFLMIDIDDFKPCNDVHGHLVGDAILKEMGRIMKESVREIDIVTRYGGEEFGILLHETAGEAAMAVAERLRKKVAQHTFKAYDENLKVTASIGLSVYPEDARGAREIIARADLAMYDAKKSGKNVVRRYKK